MLSMALPLQNQSFVKDSSMEREIRPDGSYQDANNDYKSSITSDRDRDHQSWKLDIFQILGTAAAIGSGTARPLMVLVFGGLANEFNNFKDTSALRKTVNREALYLVYLFIGQWALTCLYGILLSISAMKCSRRLRAAYLKSAIRQDIGLVSQGKAADNMASSIEIIEDAMSEKLGIVMQSGSTIIASLVIAFVHNWQLTLVLFWATIFLLFVSNFGTAALDAKSEQRSQESDEEAATFAEECLNGIRIVKACVAESKLAKKYANYLEKSRDTRMRKSPILAAQFSMTYFALLGSFALAFWYGTILLNQGKIGNGGTVVIVMFSVNQGTNGMKKILPIYGLLSKAIAASKTLSKVINSTPTIDSLGSGGVILQPLKGDIRLQNIDFSYSARSSVKVLQDLSIHFEAGKTTALIGASGSGKSTIVGLLERWYDPLGGAVLLDDHNVDKLNVKFLRSNIGLVQQDVTLFNDSIFYNVACGLYGTPFEALSEEEKRAMVRKSCIEVGAHSFIESLPNGYETKVGDKGNHLSGGQKQRISIARAIISSPKILIFDEATSGLDVESERIVEIAIQKVSGNRTTIIIAHKLSFVQRADQIVLLKNGQVLEKGTHQSLLDMNGKYAQFYESQQLDATIQSKDFLEIPEIDDTEENDSFEKKFEPTILSGNNPVIPISTLKSPDLSLFQCLFSIIVEHRFMRWLLTIIIPACVVGGGVFPAQSILFGNSVAGLDRIDNTIQIHENFWSLMWFIIALASFFVFLMIGALSSIMGTTVKFYYQNDYFKSMLQQNQVFFDQEKHSAGSLVASLSLHTSQMQNLLTVLGSLLVAFVGGVSCSILALAVNWRLALVGIFGGIPVIVLAGYLRVRSSEAKSKSLSEPLLNSAQYVSEVIGALRTVAALTMEREVCLQLDRRMRESVPSFYKNIFITMPLFAFSQSGPFLGMALVFWYGGNLLAKGEIDSANLWIIFLAVVSGGECAAEFFASSSSIFRGKQSINNILNLRIKAVVESEQFAEHFQYGDEKQVSTNSITFNNVDFSYPNTPHHPVLHGITFSVDPGQRAAIVGPSGSGKSTIIAILEKFYNINNGSILIGTNPLDTLNTAAYRNTTSLVSQDTVLFEGTLRENILLGLSESDSTDERVEKAAKNANIHDFILSLPEGYNTQCGNKGIAFSGGQRQRIALARALSREPKILLLDEATSALDSLSEMEVLDSLSRISKQTTMITVAHRLATIKSSDCILVLVKGRIVERGTHAQLMEKGGTYWAMNKAQALDKEL